MTVQITVPHPPSTNALRRMGGGRFVSTTKYKAWQKEAGQLLELQRPGMVNGPIRLDIEVGRILTKKGKPDKRRRDLSNFVKPLEDLLVRHGVIDDDSKVEQFEVRWADRPDCRVTVERLEAAETSGAA